MRMLKACSACKMEKPHEDFYRRTASSDGLTPQCKSCIRKASAAKYVADEKHNKRKVVYFIRCCDYVKIGVSCNMDRRMVTMRTGNPFPITVLYVGDGYRQEEEMWHRVFAHRHHQGEWFYMPE